VCVYSLGAESQEPEYLPVPPHSCPCVRCAKKLLRKKEE
jgi:hypothetical protein